MEGCFYIWIFTFGIETINLPLSAHTPAPSPGSESLGTSISALLHIHNSPHWHQGSVILEILGENEKWMFFRISLCVWVKPCSAALPVCYQLPLWTGVVVTFPLFHSGNKTPAQTAQAELPARVFHYTTHPA